MQTKPLRKSLCNKFLFSCSFQNLDRDEPDGRGFWNLRVKVFDGQLIDPNRLSRFENAIGKKSTFDPRIRQATALSVKRSRRKNGLLRPDALPTSLIAPKEADISEEMNRAKTGLRRGKEPRRHANRRRRATIDSAGGGGGGEEDEEPPRVHKSSRRSPYFKVDLGPDDRPSHLHLLERRRKRDKNLSRKTRILIPKARCPNPPDEGEGQFKSAETHFAAKNLTIIVKDINDNVPTFQRSIFYATVAENGQAGNVTETQA